MFKRVKSVPYWTEFLTAVGLLTALALLILMIMDRAMAQGRGDLMLAKPCKPTDRCSVTWTLTSRLGQILARYERLFGNRDRSLALLGIEFTTRKSPRIWYPNFGNGNKTIIVQLTAAARRNQTEALFQLAHEAFHLVSPIPPGTRASVLEEGLATYFAIDYLTEIDPRVTPAYITDRRYREAYDRIVQLAETEPQFTDGVRRLRARTGSFSDVTIEELRAVFPSLSDREAVTLIRKF